MSIFEYNPTKALPFAGYSTGPGEQPDQYLSLVHWIQSEKFRGVDEYLRRYLIGIDDLEILQLEVDGINERFVRPDWSEVESRIVECGVWFQMLANHKLYSDLMAADELSCPDDEVSNSILSFYNAQDDGYMRVGIVGPNDFSDHQFIRESFSHIFSSNSPKLVYTFGQPGAAWMAERWALENYVPAIRLNAASEHDLVALMSEQATHLIDYSRNSNRTSLVKAVLDAFERQGKPARRIFRA